MSPESSQTELPVSLTEESDLSIEDGLFSNGAFLSPFVRFGYYGFVILGCLFLAIGVFIAALELTTMPGRWTAVRVSTGVAFAIMIAHVFVEARGTRSLSRTRWILFAASIIDAAVTLALLMKDPIGAAVFAGILLIAGCWLMAARAIITVRGGRLQRASVFLRLAVATLAWSPVLLVVSQLF